jgi:multiple sugar transport system permease protein
MNDTPTASSSLSLGQRFLYSAKWTPVVLLAPAILGLLLLTIYPLISGVRLSLVDYDLLSPGATGEWNGFANYTDLFQNEDFWNALRVTLIYTFVAVTLELFVGFGLAVLLSQNLPGQTIARTVIISAMVMTPVIVGTTWRLMYNPGWGLVNYFLGLLGFEGQAFLAQTQTVIPALIVVDIWEWAPFMMLILLAGLQSLPVEVFEAAKVDGASMVQTFRHITLPLLKPAIAVAVLIRTMDCFRVFDTIFAMTGGGPGTASQNLNIFAYYTGLEFFHISSASAVAVISLILITIICMVILRLFGTELWRSRE